MKEYLLTIMFVIFAALTWLEPNLFTFLGYVVAITSIVLYLLFLGAMAVIGLVIAFNDEVNASKMAESFGLNRSFYLFKMIIGIVTSLFIWYSIWHNVSEALATVGLVMYTIAMIIVVLWHMVLRELLKETT